MNPRSSNRPQNPPQHLEETEFAPRESRGSSSWAAWHRAEQARALARTGPPVRGALRNNRPENPPQSLENVKSAPGNFWSPGCGRLHAPTINGPNRTGPRGAIPAGLTETPPGAVGYFFCSRALSAAPRMSPSEAPESAEPYCAIASFSSATSSALIDTGDLAGAAVELGDAGVDLLADREALGPLVAAVAGKLAALDEGGEVGADDLHLEAAFLDLEHLAGHDAALAADRPRPRRRPCGRRTGRRRAA